MDSFKTQNFNRSTINEVPDGVRQAYETVVWLFSIFRVYAGVIVVKISPVAGMYGRDKQKILRTDTDVIYSFVSSLSKRRKSWIHCKWFEDSFAVHYHIYRHDGAITLVNQKWLSAGNWSKVK